jgi:predicted small lipoprotein YifL
MRPALYLVALLTGCALLGACGQKGPLFIPGDDQPGQDRPGQDRLGQSRPAQYQHSDAAR